QSSRWKSKISPPDQVRRRNDKSVVLEVPYKGISIAAQRRECARRASIRRLGRTHVAFAVHPRPVEAARAALPAGELVAGDADALDPRLGLLARGDPVDPVA